MTTPNYNISYQVTVFLINIEGKLLSKMRCDTVCKHCNADADVDSFWRARRLWRGVQLQQ